MSEPNYIICECQNCNGRIKFDANELKIRETRSIECPHCRLETIIFNKPSGTIASPSIGAGNNFSQGKKLRSSKIELFLFELTRFPTIAGAILVLLAFIGTAILVVQTRLPEAPSKMPNVSYEMVEPAPAITPNTQKNEATYLPQGAKMASKNSFPQPVVDFLLKHQGFTLKEWLNQLNSEQRQAFLKNLATILVSANSENVAAGDVEQVVRDFAGLWISALKDEATARAERVMEKQRLFTQLTMVAFGMFLSLMILCLVLVLLAIERNTRLNTKSKEST